MADENTPRPNTRKRKPGNKGRHPGAVAASAIDLREQCMQLRIDGYTYREIARELGISLSLAHDHVRTALEDRKTKTAEAADQMRAMEAERMDKMLRATLKKAATGDEKAVRSVLAIMDRRARLLGLDLQGVDVKIGVNGGDADGETSAMPAFVVLSAAEVARVRAETVEREQTKHVLPAE